MNVQCHLQMFKKMGLFWGSRTNSSHKIKALEVSLKSQSSNHSIFLFWKPKWHKNQFIDRNFGGHLPWGSSASWGDRWGPLLRKCRRKMRRFKAVSLGCFQLPKVVGHKTHEFCLKPMLSHHVDLSIELFWSMSFWLMLGHVSWLPGTAQTSRSGATIDSVFSRSICFRTSEKVRWQKKCG